MFIFAEKTPQKSPQMAIPKRKTTGTEGQLFEVDANFLPLTIKQKDRKIHHYIVEIIPDKSSRMKKLPKRLFRYK